MYLSQAVFLVEIALAGVMTTISAVTVLGNLLVFGAILVDPVNKRSVYQYFQLSLCVADVLMGAAGAGGIVSTQFGLLLGTLGIGDFIEDNAFLASFDDPEEAKRSGLNQFYFITRDAKFVVIGALVRYSALVLECLGGLIVCP